MSVENIVGLLGWPTSHSISPIMQNQALKTAGLTNWLYVPMPVRPEPKERIKEAVWGLRALGFKGANVTVPYKEAVVPYLDRLSDEAAQIGAVNTIVVDEHDHLVGHNTDGIGFINDLADHGFLVANKSILILGAGGSARALAYTVLAQKCKHLLILNRTENKASDIAHSLKQKFPESVVEAGPLAKEYLQKNKADLVINTTSLGLPSKPEESPWDSGVAFAQSQVVYDLIYNPAITPFLKQAERSKATTLNGLGMLVHQGAKSFEIWTGLKAPLSVMKSAVFQAVKD